MYKRQECAALLAELTPVRLAAGRLKTLEADTGETLGGEVGALFDWLAACLERGSVEEYEFRVSCYGMPVSYTHLDVYKRQGMTMEELDPSTRREMETIATLQNASTQDIGLSLIHI